MTRYADDSGSEPYEMGKGTCTRETAKAVLVKFKDGERWIPKSVLHDDSEVFDSQENSTGKVVVAQWWADKNLTT